MVCRSSEVEYCLSTNLKETLAGIHVEVKGLKRFLLQKPKKKTCKRTRTTPKSLACDELDVPLQYFLKRKKPFTKQKLYSSDKSKQSNGANQHLRHSIVLILQRNDDKIASSLKMIFCLLIQLFSSLISLVCCLHRMGFMKLSYSITYTLHNIMMLLHFSIIVFYKV